MQRVVVHHDQMAGRNVFSTGLRKMPAELRGAHLHSNSGQIIIIMMIRRRRRRPIILLTLLMQINSNT